MFLRSIKEQLGFEHPHILGQSMGGELVTL